MELVYRDGDQVIVSPGRTDPARRPGGDSTQKGEVMAKQLARRSARRVSYAASTRNIRTTHSIWPTWRGCTASCGRANRANVETLTRRRKTQKHRGFRAARSRDDAPAPRSRD